MRHHRLEGMAARAASVLLLAGLLGCSGSPAEHTAGNASATTAAPAAASTPAAVPTYASTLQEGIKFYQPGLPSFLDDMAGMSVHESWGRWTDGAVAVFKFTEPLPRRFTLVVTAAAYGPNLGQPATFIVGGVTQQATFTAELGKGPADVRRLDFDVPEAVDRIEVRPAKPQTPGTADARELGLALIQMAIEPRP